MAATTTPAAADWRHEYAKVLRWLVTVPAVCAVLIGAALAAAPTRMDMSPAPSTTYAADLIADRGCWTGDAPADVYAPGHAVLLDATGEARYVGPAMTGRALDALFGDGRLPTGWKVAAFCR